MNCAKATSFFPFLLNIIHRISNFFIRVATRSFADLLILFIFFALSLIGILHHEIWLDEAQHFLIARDSQNISTLVIACRNEGHPLLWDILLFIITRFSDKVIYMQLVHILISCVTVAILLKSKLSFGEKLFIIFGYFLFYEYNIISRNYGISAMLMILIILYYHKNKMSVTGLAILLFLLAQTHLFSLIFTFAFVFTWLVRDRKELLKLSKKILIPAGLITLAGWFISLYFIIPPWHYGTRFLSYDSSGYFSETRILKTVTVCLKGIFYVPDYQATGHHFINTLYYQTLNLKAWMIYFLSALAVFIPAFIIRKNRFALILFISYLLIFIPVYFFLPLVYGIRYFGFFFIVFICCYLLARDRLSKFMIFVSIMIFAVQFINGIMAYTLDLRYPFSEAKDISSDLKILRTGKEKVYILNPTLRPAISAYTGEKYFGTENGQQLSYCHWDEQLPITVLKAKLHEALNMDSTSLVISNTPFRELIDTTKLQKLAEFSNGIFIGENASIYRYRR